MKMNKEEYEKLLKRFALELSEVGVSESLTKAVEAQYNRTPNVISAHADETTDRFVYRHNGFLIEAIRSVSLKVKQCSK